MSAPGADLQLEELMPLLRRLKMPYVRRAAPEVLVTARAQRWDPAEVLKVLLEEEVAGRDRSGAEGRLKAAGFPSGKTFDGWDEEASPIPAPTQRALRTLEWVGRRESLAVCGPSGTGKSHFLEALGHLSVERGLRVAWFSLEALGALVRRHRTDDSVGRAISRLLRSNLVVVDDIGMLPVGPDAAEGSTGLSTRRTNAARWLSPPTSTPQGGTSSCRRPSPPPPWTVSSTTRTWS